MTIVVTNPSSSIADVIRCVRDIFAALPSQLALAPEKRVTITIGKRPTYYEGAPPRVHFRPDRGTWGDPPIGTGGMGFTGGAAIGCSVYVWGPSDPGGDPFKDYDGADALTDQVWDALNRAARGRISGDTLADPSKPNEENFGQAYLFRFGYSRGIQRNQEIWKLPATGGDRASPADINRPPGAAPSVVQKLGVTVTPQT